MDGGTFNYGGVSFPLTASTSNTLLQDADPVLYWALQFYASVLTTHMGDRLLAVAQDADAPITAAVQYTTPLDPVPWLLEEHFRFPLLALYRISGKNGMRTYNWSHETTKLGIAYILPPLTAGQAEAVAPILSTIPLIIANRTQQGFDPAFMSGAKVWSGAFAGLENIDAPVEGTFGMFPGVGDLAFPAWTGTITVNERQMSATDLSTFVGVDAIHDLVNAGQTTIPDFVDFTSDVAEPGPTTG